MSNHLKIKPVGLDHYIQQQQINIYNTQIGAWGLEGLTANQFEVYGRAARNWKTDGYIPEVFSQGKEYKEVLFDDRLAALIFFGLNDPETVTENQTHTYKVSIYGFVNLDKIKPDNNGQRVDMEVMNEIINLVDRKYGFVVTAVYRDIDHILQYFSGKKIKDGVKQFNMQPNLSFRIDCDVIVNIALPTFCNSAINYPVFYNAMTCTYVVEFKDNPDTSAIQVLCNGRTAQLQFPTGTSVTIPHMIGRYVLKVQVLDGQNVVCTRDVQNGIFYYPGEGQFTDGLVMYIDYNEN